MRHTGFRNLLALFLLVSAVAPAAPGAHYIIGTGSKGATFYPMAFALCEYIASARLDFTCEAVATPGSKYNLQGLQKGEFDLALSQASLQYLAWQGQPPFDSRYDNVRTLAPLHQEVFVLAVRSGVNASALGDLQGKRLNIGNEGSGSRLITEDLMDYLALDQAGYKIYSAPSADLPDLFCSGELDAAIYSTGHPNSIYSRLVEDCSVELVDLWSNEIADFVASRAYLIKTKIPAHTYPGIISDRIGFGIQVVLSVHRRLPLGHVATILEILEKQAQVLAGKVPAYRHIGYEGDVPLLAAPRHEGVTRYRGGLPPG